MADKKEDTPEENPQEDSEENGDISEDEIARAEAEMAAAAAAEEEAAAAAEKESAEPEAEASSEDVDEDEIAKVEAEMAAAAAAEEAEIARVEAAMAAEVAAEEPESEPKPKTTDSIRSEAEEVVFRPPSIPKGKRTQDSPVLESDSDLGPMRDVEVEVKGVIFQKETTIGELAKIEVGSIVRGTSAEDPLVVQVGERKVAKGRAVVVDDRYGVVIDELII